MPLFRRLLSEGLPITLAAQVVAAFPCVAQTAARNDSAAPRQIPAVAGVTLKRLDDGAVVRTVHADSIVPTAPIFQFTDLLTARLPGVTTQSGGGQAGFGGRVTVRGRGSILLANDPAVYLDGVRIAADPGHPNYAAAPANTAAAFQGVLAPGRLEDVSPDEIERIEVLSGPQASTIYGLDAANGVVLITSKAAHPEAVHWAAIGEYGPAVVAEPRVGDSYTGWGHVPGTGVGFTSCVLVAQQAGQCVLDSLTRFSPLRSSSTTPLTHGARDRYALQVPGTDGPARYFLSGERQNEMGMLHMPPPDASLFRAGFARAPLDRQLSPNALNRTNLRATLGAGLGDVARFSLFGNAIGTDDRATDDQALASDVALGSGSRSITDGWLGYFRPWNRFAPNITDRSERYVYGGTGTWHATRAITASVTASADRTNAHDATVAIIPNAAPPNQVTDFIANSHNAARMYTGSAAVVAAVGGQTWSSQTSAGLRYHDVHTVDRYGGALSGPNGTLASLWAYREQAVVERSVFVEEAFGLADRWRFTAGAHADGVHGFLGKSTRVYPRAAASWDAWSRGADGLHVRAAYGESGNLAGALASVGPIAPPMFPSPSFPDFLSLIPPPIVAPLFRPERTREVETGADATVLGGRVIVTTTIYQRSTTDALIPMTVGTIFGPTVELRNAGSVRNRGVEVSVEAVVLRSAMVRWDASLAAWANQNRLLSIGRNGSPILFFPYRNVVGHPLGALWEPTLSYQDLNGDGMIEPSEISLTRARDQGSSVPTRALSLQNSVGLLGDRLRFGALMDYRGGNRLIDELRWDQLTLLQTRGAVDRKAPPGDQATAMAAGVVIFGPDGFYYGPAEDGSFLRLREVSVTLRACASLARTLRTSSASISLLARNLWIWTRFTGTDPEINTNAFADPVSTRAIVPQPRYFVLRVNLGM